MNIYTFRLHNDTWKICAWSPKIFHRNQIWKKIKKIYSILVISGIFLSHCLVTSNIFTLSKLFNKECLMYWIVLKLSLYEILLYCTSVFQIFSPSSAPLLKSFFTLLRIHRFKIYEMEVVNSRLQSVNQNSCSFCDLSSMKINVPWLSNCNSTAIS